MLIFVKYPFEVGDSFAKFDLLPYFSIANDATDEIFVIVAIDDCKGELIIFINFYFEFVLDDFI